MGHLCRQWRSFGLLNFFIRVFLFSGSLRPFEIVLYSYALHSYTPALVMTAYSLANVIVVRWIFSIFFSWARHYGQYIIAATCVSSITNVMVDFEGVIVEWLYRAAAKKGASLYIYVHTLYECE